MTALKILIINSEYPPVGGGAGNASANIAAELARGGDTVLLMTTQFGDFPRDAMCDGVRVLRVPSLRQRVDRSTAIEQISFLIAATRRSSSLAEEFRPDATLAFFGLPSGAVAWWLKRRSGTPYVVSLRGGDVPGFRPYDFGLYHKLAAPALRLIWHNAQAVVANSQGLRDLARAFDPSVEIPVVPNGVDLGKFSSSGRDWSSARILSVGRAVYQKGLDIAVRALAGLQDLPWEWRIAGDGPQLDALRNMVREHGLQDRVHFLGWQTPDQLRVEYGRATLFLLPSRHEGMPNALLEAMASGLPAVATRIAGSEELVVEGETGTLVPPENPAALQEALRPFLADAAIRQRMGQAARRRVEQSFTWTRAAEQYHSILERALP